MNGISPSRRLVAEGLGTALLLATVVGSGIMADRLAGGNEAIALLGNTLPTGAILVVLILVFGPLSGAHFNPAVSLVFALRGELPWPMLAAYVAAQIAGAVLGVLLAHLMFDLPVWQVATTIRSGPGQWLAEFVATFGLLIAILGCLSRAPQAIPYAVGLYITAAYWFTVDLFRQSGRHNCSRAHRHLRRNPPRRRSTLHRRAVARRRRGARPRGVAVQACHRREARRRRNWILLPVTCMKFLFP